MESARLREVVFPRLARARVKRLTLTGGEPLVHPQIIEIAADAVSTGFSVGICTNGTGATDELIRELRKLQKVHVNVSLDGFSPESHGRFRGDVGSFEHTVDSIRRFSEAGLLQGLLSTPNALTSPSEYTELASFAVQNGAEYLLMNPLSSFGRGFQSRSRLAAEAERMSQIREATISAVGEKLDVVPIRFPNTSEPLGSCIAGQIIYVFADGSVAVCPYLVFAARTPDSRHSDAEFIVGNVFQDEVADALDAYKFHERYAVGANSTCSSCSLSGRCGKGCPAAVVAAGGYIGNRDVEVCPIP